MEAETAKGIAVLRRLTLEEAQIEFPDLVLPCPPLCGTWEGVSFSELKSLAIIVSLVHVGEKDSKKAALIALLREISDHETNGSAAREASKIAFLEKYGVDNEDHWDTKTSSNSSRTIGRSNVQQKATSKVLLRSGRLERIPT